MAQVHALITLPAELQLAVVEHLHDHEDRSSLAFTCKNLHKLIVPSLYEAISLDLDKCAFPQLNGFFIGGNSGHVHIKSLVFEPDCPGSEATPRVSVRLALQLLSRNTLRSIEFPSEPAADAETLVTLFAQQACLQSIKLGRIGDAMQQVVQSNAVSVSCFQSITSLILPETITGASDLEGCQKVIEGAATLKKLEMSICECLDKSLTPQLQDHASYDGIIVKLLFAHIAPYGSQRPLALSQLELFDTTLSYASRTWLRVIDFTKLVCLSLRGCTSVEMVLLPLAAHFKSSKPALKAFNLEDDCMPCNVVEMFLASFTGLESLALTQSEAVPNFIPDLRCIEGHASTLRQLRLAFYEDTNKPSLPSSLPEHVCLMLWSKFTKLEQVALPMATYHYRTGWGDQPPLADCYAALIQLAALPKLRLLRIMNFPLLPDGTFLLRGASDDDSTEDPAAFQDGALEAPNALKRYRILEALKCCANVFYGALADRSITNLPYLCIGDYAEIYEETSGRSLLWTPTFFRGDRLTNRHGEVKFVATMVFSGEVEDTLPGFQDADFLLEQCTS